MAGSKADGTQPRGRPGPPFPHGSDGKVSACNAGDRVQFLGREDPLEKEMTIHSSTLAWNTGPGPVFC